jgi:hypothetical protein
MDRPTSIGLQWTTLTLFCVFVHALASPAQSRGPRPCLSNRSSDHAAVCWRPACPRLCLLDGDSPPGPAASSSRGCPPHRQASNTVSGSPCPLVGGCELPQFFNLAFLEATKSSMFYKDLPLPRIQLKLLLIPWTLSAAGWQPLSCPFWLWTSTSLQDALDFNFHYGTSTSNSTSTSTSIYLASKSINLSRSCVNLLFIIKYWQSRARICKRLRSPVLEFLNYLLGPGTEWE